MLDTSTHTSAPRNDVDAMLFNDAQIARAKYECDIITIRNEIRQKLEYALQQ